MKKVLSLVLAFVLVLGMVPVFANDMTPETAFDALKGYEFVDGDENGNPMLDEVLTREQLAKIYATVAGKDADALEFAQAPNYDDADQISEWAVPYVAYAQENGWMIGDGTPNTFRPEDRISGQELLTAMLRMLGYTEEAADWTNVPAFAEEIGLPISSVAEITRADVFVTLYAAVAEIKGEDGLTLVQRQGKEEVPVTELEVVDVTANNLMQVVVEFNMNVEDNEEVADVANYELDAEDIDNVVVDGNLAVLTLDAAVAQQKVAELTISNKIFAEETVEEVQFLDTTMPAALNAEVVGEKTIKFTYSEPVKEPAKSNFVIDGGNLFIESIEMLNNNTEVNVTLYSALEEGSLAVKTSGVEDFAGFSILSQTFQVSVVVDEDAPVVVGYKEAKPTEVTLIFSEEVKLNGALNTAKYYHTNGNNTADDVVIDGNEVTIKFADADKMSPGSSYVYILKDQLVDLWSNKNAQVMYQVDVELDVVSPEVKSHKVTSETTLEVVFTEDVTAATAGDEDNYKLLFEGDEVAFIDGVTATATKVTIDFTKKLAGDYVLVIENVEDLAGNEIAATSVGFTVDDMTAPKFADFEAVGYNLGAKGQMVKINFGEKMAVDGAYSVNDIDKYIVTTVLGGEKALADLKLAATITVVDNGEAIEIKIPSVADDTDTTDANPGFDVADLSTIEIARVADAAGNKTADLSAVKTINGVDAAGITYTVEQTSAKTFVVKFSERLTDFDADDFEIYYDVEGTDTEITAIASRSIAVVSNKTQVTYTLVNALDTDTDVSGLKVKAVVTAPATATATKNAYGQTVKLGEVVALDKAAPTLLASKAVVLAADPDDATVTTTGIIHVKFGESLKATVDTLLVAQDFVVEMAGDVLVPGIDYTVAFAEEDAAVRTDDTVVITLSTEFAHDDEVKVGTRDGIKYISDVPGNKISAIATKTLVPSEIEVE